MITFEGHGFGPLKPAVGLHTGGLTRRKLSNICQKYALPSSHVAVVLFTNNVTNHCIVDVDFCRTQTKIGYFEDNFS